MLDHRGQTVSELVDYVKARSALDRMFPEDARLDGSSLASEYDGVLATGGFLRSASRDRVLGWYRELLAHTDRPFLGVCLGLKILGHCYGARMRKIAPDVGFREIRFQREFPLAPQLTTVTAYENHKYELVPPLPEPLESYATSVGSSPVQAVAVRGKQQFGVQFHPEVGSTSSIVLERFVSICSR